MAPALRDQPDQHLDPLFWEQSLGPAFAFLASDPTAGVTIVHRDMRVLFTNRQAVAIFSDHPPDPSEVIGKSLSSMCPAAWVTERERAVDRVLRTHRPLLMRVVWRGLQHVNWMQAIDEQIAPEGAVLVITRRVEGEFAGSGAAPPGAEVLESEVISLGPLEVLSDRELEILALIGQGLTIRAIGQFLHRSEKTIEHHRLSIGRKLNATNRAQLIEFARAAGLTVADAQRLRL